MKLTDANIRGFFSRTKVPRMEIWRCPQVSVLLVICSVVGFTHRKITKLITEKRKSRKLTVQSTSTEMATVEEMESPRPESRTETVWRECCMAVFNMLLTCKITGS